MSKRIIQIDKISKLNIKSLSQNDDFNVIQYLDTGNITKNKICDLQIFRTKKEKIPSRAKRRVKKNTIIYSTVRPNQEHFGFLENPDDNLIVSTGFTTVDIIDEDIDPKFTYYLITQKQITDYLHCIGLNTTSSYPSIKPEDIGILKFKVPERLEDQQKIAAVLSILDTKIELNNKINAELESMAKTIYDYWFVQFDFPDENGKPYKSNDGKMVWSEELKRKIPDGWEVKNLKNITEISNDSLNPLDYPNKEFRYFSIPTFDETGTYGLEKGENIQSNKFIVSTTDILVSKLNPWFNRVIYSTDESNLICSTEFVVWRPKNTLIKNYLFMIARNESFITFCVNSVSGTSHSHKRINPTVMMKHKLVYNHRVAELFGVKIEPFIKLLAKNKVENKTLSDLRDWLLPMLMNGQVKVN